MACPRNVGLGLLCLFAVLIQGCFCEEDENVIPNEHNVPEKLEHGEKGTVHYNVDTVKLTGSKHTKMDDNKNERPPWPPRPGRRNIIPLKAKKALPTIIRPGRSILVSLTGKAKRSYQDRVLRPGRGVVPNGSPDQLLRPGREDVPEGPQMLYRPGRDAIPQYLYRPGREVAGPPSLFRPGREDVPQNAFRLFRPGRDDVPNGPPALFRPGREDVPQMLYRPGRDEIPDQFNSVRAGRRSLGYNMPWTYEGSTVNSNVQRNSQTFRQKALEETTKRNFQDNKQEMSDPSSFQDEEQDF
ncbi:uncharacterized protein LOC116298350 [Actinia tenebrosa]|uniref:Uncharacterized protein LOC116298350 n=1 Tax=Actinia tenebrosa TaxID=6105 RepID=A0A6P8I426_ACTTE|nr:uncharacterized protein LOC116298350 [Actinia tenebrosa]